ncbi:MAG: M48 metallopeptidase family protein [Neptuniibacter sp.]
MANLKYLQHYPERIRDQAIQMLKDGRLGALLLSKYPVVHTYQSNRALYDYTINLKNTYLKKSSPLSKVEYSDKVSAINALGVHSRISRIQGSKLKSKKQIQIDSKLKAMPIEFLRMLVVHELAHFKELDHNKAFYQLCLYMEPNYYQYELDLRLYLTWLDENPSIY